MKTQHNNSKAVFALAATLLLCTVNTWAQNGTWTNLVNGAGGGSWPTAVNWNNGSIADGADSTADFSTLDITNLSTVTLDGARTIGNLIFGDTTPDTNWVLSAGSGDPLTLSVSAGSPTITVNNQTATIGAVLAGAGGFTKAGAGTLTLNNTGNLGLAGDISVTEGVLGLAANTGTLGAASDGAGANLVIVTNGGTLYLRPNVQINNKQLKISGAGANGQGALDADASGTSNGTRWGIGGSTALVPFVALTGDATLRVDGASAGNNNSQFLLHSLDIGTNTLTKTGGGRLNFDQQNRTSGDGLVHVVEGGLGFRSGGFTGGRSLTVDSGAEARITGDNNAMNSTVNTVTINGQIDLDARGSGNVGSDTTTFSQRVGLLAGSGIITSGTFGNTGTQTLTIEHDETTNSTFDGTITQANGTLRLVKAGANTLTLTGTNTYAGMTTINAGTLLVDGAYTGIGNYAVNSGATLGGNGTISAMITNSGTIMAGDPATGGTLTINSNILGNYSDTIVISNATLAANAYIGPDSQVVGTLYMTNGTLQMPLRTTGPSAFVSTVNVDGNATISFSMGTPLTGQFPIISCSSIGGLAGFSGLSLMAPAGITATLSNNTANLTIDLIWHFFHRSSGRGSSFIPSPAPMAGSGASGAV